MKLLGEKRTISVESVVAQATCAIRATPTAAFCQQYGARVYLAVATLCSSLWLSLINIHDVYGLNSISLFCFFVSHCVLSITG